MDSPHLLKAILRPAGTGKVKIRWKLPAGSPIEYVLETAKLGEREDACRTALNKLQTVKSPQDEGPLGHALRALADSGAELYEELMTGTKERADKAVEFRQWFEQEVAPTEPGTWRVEFQYDGIHHPVIPWGLTYGPRPARTARGTAFLDYIDFWAHRYATASYLSSADSEFDEVKHLNGKEFVCWLVFEVSDTKVDVEVALHDGLRFSRPLRSLTIREVRVLREKFEEHRAWNHVVYISLRSKHGGYPLKDGQFRPKDLEDINQILNLGGGHGIALIDREAIIRGDRGEEWRASFFNDRWAGLIAAETDIESPHLWYKGFGFLTELLRREEPLTLSLRAIREQFWPFSLLYGIYSNPARVFVKPPPQIVEVMLEALKQHKEGLSQ
jgi:hypothetical protein